jgi:hypothetical protein
MTTLGDLPAATATTTSAGAPAVSRSRVFWDAPPNG